MVHDIRHKTEVLVIGTGIAGSTAAIRMADNGLQVTLVTGGTDLYAGNTALAQGGIVYTAEGDDPKLLEKDMLTAGWKVNSARATRFLSRKGPDVVKKFLIDKINVPFAQRGGTWHLTREGGHCLPRILHCADHTGRTIMESLAGAVSAHPNITVLTERTAIDLLTTQHHAKHLDFRYNLSNQCVGAYVFNQVNAQVETILADFTLLATGGAGQVYLHTTNTRGSIGSGMAMANRAGARIVNAEYMQFHPTALYQGSKKAERRFLVSEAVRGEGAVLVDASGDPFMSRHDPRADLAPRDIVTRAIMDELLITGDDCVYLDATRVEDDLKTRFPTIYEKCMEMGIDMERDPIPVVPAAHYFCGGVLVDNRGRTTIDRLSAAGEASCTGIHGANRLASTSLLEGLLWGYSAADDITARHRKSGHLSRKLQDAVPDWKCPGATENEDPALIAQDWSTIRHTMWNYVGVSRSQQRLNRAFSDLRTL
ncbi:MAG: L-aspartate oxidase, partial [Desulfovibrionaceae bacterium]